MFVFQVQNLSEQDDRAVVHLLMLAFGDPEVISVEPYLGTPHGHQEEVSQLADEECHLAAL
jgi:hypothetical protein